MNIYPAIDILNGQAVRLQQGRRDSATVYGDPVDMAARWSDLGATWIHIVDLDGAFDGQSRNLALLERIRSTRPSLRIQLGGGIRDLATIERRIALGVERVVLGTAAVEDPDLVAAAVGHYGNRIAVGIDARDGIVRTTGWTTETGLPAHEFAEHMKRLGVRTVIHTDISRDGELSGPNIEATVKLVRTTGVSAIVSGGVSTIDDVRRIRDLDEPGIDGVIVGKALYEGRLRLEEALAYAG